MSRQESSVDGHPVRSTSLAVRRLLWLAIPLITGLLFNVAAYLLTSRSVSITGGCAPSINRYLDSGHVPPDSAITYCGLGDRDRISLMSNWLPQGTRRIDIETAGYGAMQEQTLSLQASDGQSIPIPLPGLGEHWTPQTIIVPATMSHQRIHLVMADGTDMFQGWSGLAVTSHSSVRADLQVIAKLVWILGLLHFLAVETALMLSRRLPRDQALVAALLALGVASCVTVWTTYAFGKVGAFTGMAIFMILLLHTVRCMWNDSASLTANFRYFNKLLAPVSSSTLFVFVLSLYPFPQDWDTWQYAANRWQSLPMDIWLPKYFADQLWTGHVAHPMIGSWLSSDRPPLQAGFYLMFKPLAEASGALYLMPAIWLQATCIVPMYYIVRGLRGRMNPAPIIMLISVSALFLYNGGFVWPKLIAATYCAVTYLALLSTTDRPAGWIGKGVIAGLGSALAMLSHGGAAFALFAVFTIYLFDSHRDKWRIIALAGAIALLAYLPWMLYQKFADPPGTRLLAWQLAGARDSDSHPIGWILRNAYAQLTPEQWLRGRIANLEVIIHGTMGFFGDFLELFGAYAREARVNILVHSFFNTFYTQWFFSPLVALGLLALARRHIATLRAMLMQPLAVMLAGLIFWTIVMFTPGSTIIHQGAYFLDLLGLVIVGSVAWTVSARLFYLLLGLNIFIMIDVFVRANRITATANPPLPTNMQSQFWVPSHDHAYLTLAVAAMVLNFVVIWHSYHAKENEPHPLQNHSPHTA
jgi:hypothetical protein